MITPELLSKEPWFSADEYPFTPHWLEVDGGRMHYLDEGQGPVVVFVHGTPSWSYESRKIVQALKTRYRCIVADHLGFGLSSRPQDWSYTLEAHSENLARLVDHLHLEKFTLVLHDFGGPIGIPVALKNPARVERIVVMNSWLWPMEEVDPKFAKQKKLLTSGLMRFFYLRMNFSAQVMVKLAWGKLAPLTRRTHDSYRRMFPNKASRVGTWAFARAVAERGEYLSGLRARCRSLLKQVPTQLIWGMSDAMITAKNLPLWRDTLHVVDTREIAGAGHFLQDEAPAEVTDALKAFLEGK
jgi:pimeloyl-ACP methyl ester carboxylesterase